MDLPQAAEQSAGFVYWYQPILAPSTSEHLGVFYLFWIGLFIVAHVIWDVFSKETPGFSLMRLEGKLHVLFSASTCASSLMVLLSVIEPSVRQLLADNGLPLILAGFSGMLSSLSALTPEEIRLGVRERASKDTKP